MEEIKIYRSMGKNVALIAVCDVFALIGMFLIIKDINPLAGWVNVAFFGLGGLFLTYQLVRQRAKNIPYLAITDDGFSIDSTRVYAVNFSNVDHFELITVSHSQQIAIYFKPEVAAAKLENASTIGKTFRNFNQELIGTQESFPVDALTVKPQAILDLLNERLQNSHQI